MGVGLLLAALALLLSAAPAVAGTATLVSGREGSVTTARVAYDAAPGEGGRLIVEVFRADDFGEDRFERGAVIFGVGGRGVTPGPGCDVDSPSGSVVCLVHAGARLRGPVVYAGDRADEVIVSVAAPGTEIFGGSGADRLTADVRGPPRRPFQVRMYGGPGNDSLEGSGTLHGGPGADNLDAVTGGPSRIFGGPGDDNIGGSERADMIVPGPGREEVFGSGGDDRIRAIDGSPDLISCEGGRDTVFLDQLDFYEEDCNRVRRRGLARSLPVRAFGQFEAGAETAANTLGVTVTCPFDGPRPCSGTVVVSDRRGVVLRRTFRSGELGLQYPEYQLSRRALPRLIKWARITVVSPDRLGQQHSYDITGPDVVDPYSP